MSLKLYGHPFSSYFQKALIAFYENEAPFELQMLSPDHPEVMAEFAKLWPMQKFPILKDGGRVFLEASIIIEHLQIHHPGPIQLIPDAPAVALNVRMMDRFFDNYVSTPQQKIVFNSLRPVGDRDALGDVQARQMLETSYAWLEEKLQGHTWACGNDFTMADCAAAPSLFYADWTHAIPDKYKNVHAYRRRLLARPSFARAVNEARPYRSFFPLGAPDRD